MNFIEALERRSVKNKEAFEEAILKAIEAIYEALKILDEEGDDLLNIEYPLSFDLNELPMILYAMLEAV